MPEDKAVVEYQTDTGAVVKLSPSIIRRYLVNGQGQVSDQEVMMFLMLCKQQRLDPFLREAYLIKYGSSLPATMVTGKEVFTKRAERHPDMRGMVSGVVVTNGGDEPIYREGSLILEGETLVGGWAKVWKHNREVPYQNSVSLKEYIGLKKDGTPNSQWSSMPATMIRKVALVQTLREVFPETFSGLYDPDEMKHIQSDTLDDAPVERDVTPEHPGEGDAYNQDVTSDDEPAQPTVDPGKAELAERISNIAKGEPEQEEIF